MAEIMYKLTSIIMEFAPYGVFALIAVVIGQYGVEFLLPLFKVIMTVYLACLLHLIIVFGGGMILIGRLNPLRFFKGFFIFFLFIEVSSSEQIEFFHYSVYKSRYYFVVTTLLKKILIIIS